MAGQTSLTFGSRAGLDGAVQVASGARHDEPRLDT